MAREKFTDHDGEEAPDFEIEEVEDKDGKKPDKGGDKGKDDAFDDGADDEEPEDKKPAKKADDEDEEEEIVEEADDEKARLQAENEALRQSAAQAVVEKTASELEQAKYLSTAIEQRIKDLRDALVTAKKDEDVEAQAKIENQLEEIKEAKAKTDKLVGELTEETERIKKEGVKLPGGQVPPGTPRTEKARSWARNNAWMADPKNQHKKAVMLSIDAELAKKGLDPNSEEYFKQLSKRMAAEFPNLGVKYLDGKAVVTTKRKPGGDGKKSPHGEQRTAGRQADVDRPSRPRLEDGDRAKMRRFGLDPENKDHVKHWLRSKAEVAAQEKRRAEE